MRWIERKPPLACLNNIPQDTTWDNFRRSYRDCLDSLYQYLRQEQLGLCCYCESPLYTGSDRHIEHMMPKSLPPYRHLDYSNLALCCEGGRHFDKANQKWQGAKHCGHYKDQNKKFSWDEKKFSDPHDKVTQKLFMYMINGKVIPTEVDQKKSDYMKSDYMIEYLGLNSELLVNKRLSLIEVLFDTKDMILLGIAENAPEEVIEAYIRDRLSDYIEKDKSGYLPPFHSLAAQLLYNDMPKSLVQN